MDAHLATTLRTAETLLLSPPVQVVPDAVLRDSWRVASQLDARAPADVLAGLDPATARGSVEGCLFQLKLFRIFLGRLCEPSDEPAAARLAEAVAEVLGELRDSGESGAALVRASGGESSSESESSASEDEPDAPLDAGDALDASISSDDSDDETAGAARPGAAAPASTAASRPGEIVGARRHAALGAARVPRGAVGAVAPRALPAARGPRGLSLVNIAHRDKAAAGAIADGGGCHLLVSALFGLAGDDGDVRAAHAAGAWALGALAPLDGLREDGATVRLAAAVKHADAAALLDEVAAPSRRRRGADPAQAAFDRADGDARDGAAAPEDPRGCVVT
ncbi:low voltage-gated calcium channel [Aureococcus anophagefferens]|nr:low voltage-gated calcium channel [Aureococcus anophagefferens]